MTALQFCWSLIWISSGSLALGLLVGRWLNGASHEGRRGAARSGEARFRTAATAHAALAIAIVVALIAPALRTGALAAGWGVLPGEAFVRATAPLDKTPPAVQRDLNAEQPNTSQEIRSLNAAPLGEAGDWTAAPAASKSVQQPDHDAPATGTVDWSWISLSSQAMKRLPLAGAILWAALSLFVALRLVVSLLRSRRWLASSREAASPALAVKLSAACELLGVRRVPRLVVSGTAGSPAIWCWSRRPLLAIPAAAESSTDIDWTAIFCHELAHLRRRDHLWGALAELLVVLLPWNPLSWLARRRLAQLSELACDDWVLGTGQSGVAYADSLLNLTPRPAGSLMPAAVSLRSNLAERIGRLLTSRSIRPRVSRAAWLAMCGVALFACTAIAVAGPRPDAEAVIEEPAQSPAPQQPGRQPLPSTEPAPVAPGQRTAVRLSGTVVDANGAPIVGATVVVQAHQRRQHAGGILSGDQDINLATGASDDAGRFELVVPIAADTEFYQVRVAAAAAGHAINWVTLPPSVSALAVQPPVEIKLPPERIVRGRLLDPEGKPAAGVLVSATGVGRPKPRGEGGDGIRFSQSADKAVIGPKPVVTDADGRFEFHGLDDSAVFQVRDDRYKDRSFAAAAPKEPVQRTLSETKEPPKTNYLPNGDIEVPLSPAQYVEGTVRYADTGLPAPGTRLGASEGPFMTVRAETVADAQGHFRIKAEPEENYQLVAFPAERQPYLIKSQQEHWPAGTTQQTVDVELRRGTLIEGTVSEKASREFPQGRPIAGAGVFYEPRSDNKFVPEDYAYGRTARYISDADGHFWIAVPPGVGHLLVNAPSTDYIATLISSGELREGKPGGSRYRPDGLAKLDIAEGTDKQQVAIELRRGVTIHGRLRNPDGTMPERALLINPLHKYAFDIHWRGNPNYIEGKRFEVHGCDPAQPLKLSFLDPEKKTGATVELTGEQIAALGEIIVTLAPCGSAVARFIDQHGQPREKANGNLEIVAAPGFPSAFWTDQYPQNGELMADSEMLINVDRLNYWERRAGPDGVLEMPALIPGATYRIYRFADGRFWLQREFQVKSGERIDLGDIVNKQEEKLDK